MKKIITLILLLSITVIIGCESTPDQTIGEAAQHIEKGVTGQGKLVERDWEEVTGDKI